MRRDHCVAKLSPPRFHRSKVYYACMDVIHQGAPSTSEAISYISGDITMGYIRSRRNVWYIDADVLRCLPKDDFLGDRGLFC